MNLSGHLSDDTLDDYLLGRLSGAALTAADSHLVGCETCRRRLARLDGFVAGLRRMAESDSGITRIDPLEPSRTNGHTSDPTEREDESGS